MKAIDAWWTLHPHLVELVFFCVACFLALFPGVSRKGVLAPFFYSALGALRFMQRDAQSQLKIIRLIDGSTFKLVAYIAY